METSNLDGKKTENYVPWGCSTQESQNTSRQESGPGMMCRGVYSTSPECLQKVELASRAESPIPTEALPRCLSSPLFSGFIGGRVPLNVNNVESLWRWGTHLEASCKTNILLQNFSD